MQNSVDRPQVGVRAAVRRCGLVCLQCDFMRRGSAHVHARARVLNRAKVEEARDVAAKQREQLHRQRPAALQHPRTHKRSGGGGDDEYFHILAGEYLHILNRLCSFFYTACMRMCVSLCVRLCASNHRRVF